MTEKINQHYVPKFALRHFAADPKKMQINICIGEKRKIVRRASLRDQCSKRYFYSKNRSVEDGLAEIEANISKLYDSIIKIKNIPRKHKANVAVAISLQRGRTEIARKNTNSLVSRMAKLHVSHKIDRENLSKINVIDKKASLRNLYLSIQSWPSILDLNQYILINTSNIPFVYSDNPVVFTNWFAKGRYAEYATVGTMASGLQIFLPISPMLGFYLHDSNVYYINQCSGAIELNREFDVLNLNNIQYRNSHNCIYFSSDFDMSILDAICSGEKFISTPELRRYWKSDDSTYKLTGRDEYEPPRESGEELVTFRYPDPPFYIRFKGLRIRDKPRVFDDGSAVGPQRDPAWAAITRRFSKQHLRKVHQVDDFWDFLHRQPDFRYVGSWFQRDIRIAKNEAES